MKRLVQFGLLMCVAAASATAHRVKPRNLSMMEKTTRAGQFVWQPKTPSGPVSVVIDLGAQRALVFRNGVLIASSKISTGSKGRETPTGSFTILQKKVVHRSRTYDNASMPYMQRLTWKGVAMHAGHLPGYPASHGCIRLPRGFAKLLYGLTSLGTPVTVTHGLREAAAEEPDGVRNRRSARRSALN